MAPRLRHAVLAFLVVAPAALLALGDRAASQSPPSPGCPPNQLGILDVSVTGQVIDDGVGYGGIRIGDAESSLRAVWGPTPCGTGPQGTAYMYAVMRVPDQAVDMVWVHVRGGRVAAMVFVPAPHSGEARMIPLRTRQGIHVGMTLADVERGYGPPAARSSASVRYGTRGLGFIHQGGYVMGLAIFAPGTSPDLEGMWPY
jgi:hypothetical protein